MTLQDWGALGEVVGAAAVLATLIYLAIQTRQLRRTGERSVTTGVAEAHARWRSALYENPQLADLLARDNAGEALSEGERIQLRYLHFDLFIASILGHYTQERDSPRAEIDYLVRVLVENPSVHRAWLEHQALVVQMAPGLAEVVNRRLATEGDSSPGS